MSTEAAVTMQDLELESAELLPSRETLCYNPCACYHPCQPVFSICVSINIGCCL